ncbi:MAG: HlyD family type I secretion periplasmic adaptor subunit [marine bacterium B5-7]|nr:MAG: HlyD family type I secretion periplasmic adaptor subunit [marine bacterium B5-7]
MARNQRDFEAAIVSALQTPPTRMTRIVSILIILLVLLATIFLYYAKIDIVVTARGEIIPSGKVKLIQAAENGIVRAVHVRDGDSVLAGDILLDLDSTDASADLESIKSQRQRALLVGWRLRSEIENLNFMNGVSRRTDNKDIEQSGKTIAEPDVTSVSLAAERRRLRANMLAFQEEMARYSSDLERAKVAVAVSRRQIEILQLKSKQAGETLDKKKFQAEKGIIPRQEVIEATYALEASAKELEMYVERVREEEGKLAVVRDTMNAAMSERQRLLLEQLGEVEEEIQNIDREIIKSEQHLKRQVVTAPIDGVVQELAIHTIRAVVERGDVLMVIVPRDIGIEMEARIPNKDVGFVAPSQRARIKIDAFEFTRYGALDGELAWVAGDAVVNRDEGRIYPANIKFESTVLPNRVGAREARITPGMQATADIVIGERRLIEYFIAPLLRYRDESLRER